VNQPIEVRVIDGVADVRYGEESSVVSTREVVPSASVPADVDAAGTIVGIEVLFASDAAAVALARDYAHAHTLAFPRDFDGVLASG
jgi:predicted nucleic acid-binding protein